MYLGLSERGASFLFVADLIDVLSVVHAFRLITSTDAVIRDLARASLVSIVKRKIGRPPSDCDVADYLSGRLDGK